MTREDVLRTLRILKTELAANYKVNETSLFGSFVRHEQVETSDIDLLVDFSQDASFFDLVRLALFLEEKFHRKVDIVPKESLRAEIRETVLRERVTV